MSCTQCRGIAEEFGDRMARREIRRYRRKGPTRTTRMLLDAIGREGVAGRTFLDVGGGVGAIQHELAASGARGGVSVDASPAYLAAARDEAERRGYADRMEYAEGDAVELAEGLEPADIVTLDRVLCCYPDMPGLIDATAPRARGALGLVFPREHWPVRAAFRLINLVQSLRRRDFKVFLHSAGEIEARVLDHGLRRTFSARSFAWQIHLYTREPAGAGD